jgi:hypothetical protein
MEKLATMIWRFRVKPLIDTTAAHGRRLSFKKKTVK